MALDAIDLFNQKLEDFVADLNQGFPHVQDFKLLKNALRMSLLVNKNLAQQLFQEYVAQPYEAFILAKDEHFFLTESYQHVIQKETAVDMDIVKKLKLIWRTLDDASKNALWQHLHVLILLNNRCKTSKSS
jgi:hypothetical protein